MQEKMKMTLVHIHIQQQYCVSFWETLIPSLDFLADMIYDFDEDKRFPKLAQRLFFVLVFHCKDFFAPDSLDTSKMPYKHFYWMTLYHMMPDCH